MSFYLILKEIMDEQGLSIPDVARMCGLADGTVRSMFTRKQKSVLLEVAFKISNGLNVSLERLNGMDDTKKSPPICESGTRLERDLLRVFRHLNDDGQHRVIEYADDLFASGRYLLKDEVQKMA